jgi:putative endonuclease
MHYMYVVECADGTLYTGYSPDVQARVAAHNAGRGARYTRSRGPVRLVASAAFADKHQAMSAEWHFKRLTRAQKDALLARAASGEPFEDVLLQTILRPEDDSSTED